MTTRYTAYTDDVCVHVTRSTEVVEESKEIGRYEDVTRPKLTTKSLWLGLWKSNTLPSSFSWTDGLGKILGVWFGPDIKLEKS